MDNQEALDKATQYLKAEGASRNVNDIMRHQYKVLNDEEKAQMLALKDKGLEFLNLIETMPTSREMSLAKTKIEEAVMWSVKSITK